MIGPTCNTDDNIVERVALLFLSQYDIIIQKLSTVKYLFTVTIIANNLSKEANEPKASQVQNTAQFTAFINPQTDMLTIHQHRDDSCCLM